MSWKTIEFRDGREGEADSEMFRQKCLDSPKFVADCLRQHQMWRTGKGEYAWDESPASYVEPPLCPMALTTLIDEAVLQLMDYDNMLKTKKGTGHDEGSETGRAEE